MGYTEDIRAHLGDAVGALQVDRDTVLQARAAILNEAFELKETVRKAQAGARVGVCGGDPLSPRAAAAFNTKIEALLHQFGQYTEELERAGRTLDATARSYGYTDEQIAASFGG